MPSGPWHASDIRFCSKDILSRNRLFSACLILHGRKYSQNMSYLFLQFQTGGVASYRHLHNLPEGDVANTRVRWLRGRYLGNGGKKLSCLIRALFCCISLLMFYQSHRSLILRWWWQKNEFLHLLLPTYHCLRNIPTASPSGKNLTAASWGEDRVVHRLLHTVILWEKIHLKQEYKQHFKLLFFEGKYIIDKIKAVTGW